MANEQNLKPYTKGDPRASAGGKKGGPISGQVRRRKANLAKTMADLLANKTVTIDGETISYETAICLSMMKEALGGNATAARFVADVVDQAIKSKEITAKIEKLKAETDILKQQKETGISSDKVVIIDDIRNETE